MDLDQALQTFLLEGRELLGEMETALLRVTRGDDSAESINAIFRAAHTIKGSAGLFGLDPIVRFTHCVESLLDEVRRGTVTITEPLVELLLACADHIANMIDQVDSDGDANLADEAGVGAALVARLTRHMPDTGAMPRSTNTLTAAAIPAETVPAECGHWHISVRFGASVLKNGMDPLSFLRYLSTLGAVTHIVAVHDAVPSLAEIDPEDCYLGFEIGFASAADRATITNVFEFVADDCTLQVRAAETASACEGHLGALPLKPARPTDPAAETSKQPKESRASESKSVRVDADKLDRLINLVGELITVTAGAALIARRSGNVDFQESTSTLANLVEEVRDSALQLRMVKIGATFSRFERVVHDVARELGKDIELRTSGEDTELDKTLVEKIGDPLLHLVRNAIDHGIDPAELRVARGKPVRGTVCLNAHHDSGSIVIEVSDDGGGLDRERILTKAVERGLVEPGKHLTDQEVYALIFEPGFSTADVVTNLSGRGVGMDVVKRNITALRGSVNLTSRPGRGTTVTVRLPLTLAIIDGFLVAVGNAIFVLPLDMVDECVTYRGETDRDYTDLRGQVLPFIRMRDLFDISGAPAARQNIVVVKHAGQKVGLLVDQLVGEAQTVIKPLSKMFEHVKGISGSSILGTGEVALILDVPGLLQAFQRTAEAAVTEHGD
jgi:two-component system chemotaxis sensor kinase CheA